MSSETQLGANLNLWRKLKNWEKYEGERVSRRIADFAQKQSTFLTFQSTFRTLNWLVEVFSGFER